MNLLDEEWDGRGNVLSGRSAVVTADPYVMTLHLPDGFRLQTADLGGEEVETESLPETASVRITPAASKTVDWRIRFAK